MADTARDYVAYYAPQLRPWDYGDDKGWDEWEQTRLLKLAGLIDEHAPGTPADGYVEASDEMVAFRQLLGLAKDAEEEQRSRVYYRRYINERTDDIVRELREDYPGDPDTQDDRVWELVDSAVPIYNYSISRVFEEAELDVDDPEIKALAGEDADLMKLQQVAIFEEMQNRVIEKLRELREEDEED